MLPYPQPNQTPGTMGPRAMGPVAMEKVTNVGRRDLFAVHFAHPVLNCNEG